MAEKKKSKAKAQDMSSMEAGALATELKQAREKQAKLVFQHNVAPLKNPLELRHLRREIARLKTYISMKEAAK